MANPKIRSALHTFQLIQPLRRGQLFKCKACDQPWYLTEDAEIMNFVRRDRLPIVHDWNEHQIILSPLHRKELERIGRTPPDSYGNGRQFHETPCAVVTKSGERIDLAVITRQNHAPFEEYRQYRLASEIEAIHESPYALPLAVRIATSKADEIRMGFAPTLIRQLDGQIVLLNWRQNFYVRKGCIASDVALVERQLDMSFPPEIYSAAENITYFVADWEVEDNDPKQSTNALPNTATAGTGFLYKMSRFLKAR